MLSRDTYEKYTSLVYSFHKKNGRMPSYSEICKLCGLKSKNTAHNLIRKLAELGAVKIDSAGKLIPAQSKLKDELSVKLLGMVEAGFPTPGEESLLDTVSLDDWIIENREASFMLKVKGDSMKDAGILNGDMIIVERASEAKPGQIVLAEIDGNYTLKYLRKNRQSGAFLEAANSSYKPIYPKDALAIKAVLKAVIRKYGK